MNTQGGKLDFEFDLRIDKIMKNLKIVEDSIGGVSKNMEIQGNKITETFERTYSQGMKTIAGLVGAYKLEQFLEDATRLAGEFEEVNKQFRTFAGSEYLQQLREATQGTVDDLKLIKTANMAQSLGIPMRDMALMLNFAQRQSENLGKSLDEVIDKMVMGIGNKSTRGLREAGISAVELGKAFKDIDPEILSVGEVSSRVIEIMKTQMASMGEETDSANQKFERIEASWRNIQTQIGTSEIALRTAFLPVLGKALTGLKEMATTWAYMWNPSYMQEKSITDNISNIKAEVQGLNEAMTGEAIVKNIQKLTEEHKKFVKEVEDAKGRSAHILGLTIFASDEDERKVKSLTVETAAYYETVKRLKDLLNDDKKLRAFATPVNNNNEPPTPETASAIKRLNVITEQNAAYDLQGQILRDIADEEKRAINETLEAIKDDYSSWGTAQEKMDKAVAKAAQMQDQYDAQQIEAANKKAEQIQFTIGLLSEMLGLLSSITGESSEAAEGLQDVTSIMQSKSVGEGFLKLGLTIVKDWITAAKNIKENRIELRIDKITASLEKLNYQLNNAELSSNTEKAMKYTIALEQLRDSAHKLTGDFNNLRKNERRDFKIDFNTTSIERLQEIVVQIMEIQNTGDKKAQDTYKDRIDQLNEIIKLKQDELDLENKIREAITGTTAESITDAIMQGFDDGYTSIKDFGKTFEDIMKKAIINSLKVKMIEPYMNTYFMELSKAMTDGVISEDENNYLRKHWDGFLGKITTGMDQVNKLLSDYGFDTQTSQNTLAGSIQSITEPTADILAGTTNAIRLNGIQQLQAAQSGLITLNKIEANTALTRYVVDILRDINGKISSGSQFTSNRASGR